MNKDEKVDIGDFTWQQKEKVLRYLFARMNGTASTPSAAAAAAAAGGNKATIRAVEEQTHPSIMDTQAWSAVIFALFYVASRAANTNLNQLQQ